MRRWGAVAALVMAVSAGCTGSKDGGDGAPEPEPTKTELGSVSSVIELRDALVDAGYDCPSWAQDNVVDLAAESGSCDDSSVLSTYASPGDLQSQLDVKRATDELFLEQGIELDPQLVGPNWIFNAPDADKYAAALGGTVIGPPS